MAKRKYWVNPDRTLEHDGQRVEGGKPITLDEETATPLLTAGILLEDEPVEEVKATLEEVTKELEEAKKEITRLTKELEAAKKKFVKEVSPQTQG